MHRAKIAAKELEQWKNEVRAKLTPHGTICGQSKILGQYAADVVQAYRFAARKQRLDWLISEAKRHDMNLTFTIETGSMSYKAWPRRLRFTYVSQEEYYKLFPYMSQKE